MLEIQVEVGFEKWGHTCFIFHQERFWAVTEGGERGRGGWVHTCAWGFAHPSSTHWSQHPGARLQGTCHSQSSQCLSERLSHTSPALLLGCLAWSGPFLATLQAGKGDTGLSWPLCFPRHHPVASTSSATVLGLRVKCWDRKVTGAWSFYDSYDKWILPYFFFLSPVVFSFQLLLLNVCVLRSSLLTRRCDVLELKAGQDSNGIIQENVMTYVETGRQIFNFFEFKIFLFQRQSEREIERIFHPLVYSPNSCNG